MPHTWCTMHRLRWGVVGDFCGNDGNKGTIGTKDPISYLFEKQELNEHLSKFANCDPNGQAVEYRFPTIDSASVTAPLISRCALFALFFRWVLEKDLVPITVVRLALRTLMLAWLVVELLTLHHLDIVAIHPRSLPSKF